MKVRADKFHMVADGKSICKIQEIMLKHYKDDVNKTELDDLSKANLVLSIYSQIAFDEGYRYGLKETIETMKESGTDNYKNVKVVKRKKGWFEYLDEEDMPKLTPIIRRRIKSKRQRKAHEQHSKDTDREFTEESFVLAMVIHSSFEAGYLKANTLDEQIKIICSGSKHGDLVKQLFVEIFPEEVE